MGRRLLLLLLTFSLCLLLLSCEEGNSDDSDFTYRYLSASFAQSLEQSGVTADVIFYGDSRVAQGDWNSAFQDDTTRSIMNLGVGGDTTARLLLRLPVVDAVKPTYCFLAIGGNDVGGSDQYDVIMEQYETLLDELENRGITVILMTNPGLTTENTPFDTKKIRSWSTRILTLNERIRKVAEERELLLVDLVPVLCLEDGSLNPLYSSDGVHYSSAGLAAWYEALRPIVQTLQ